MPNPKTNTVTQDIRKTVENIKKGQREFKNDSTGIIHNVIGKTSFKKENLIENYKTLLDAIRESKPRSVKGVFMRSIFITTSMGPSIKTKIG